MKLKAAGEDYDMEAVAEILNKRPINDTVVDIWKEKANRRPTVVFCSTVKHAEEVAEAFNRGGVDTALLRGDLGPADRQRELEKFTNGEVSVIVNVAVLTEGWDHPPTSCVVLLKHEPAPSHR